MTKKAQTDHKRWILLLILLAMLALTQIPLPYYYTQPGEATALGQMVTVDGGYEEQGEFYLTTIRQRRATVPLYVWAQFSPYREVIPSNRFLHEDETDEEYFHRQEMMMSSAQEAAKITAFRAAGFPYDVEVLGIRVTQVIDEMNAAKHLREGDLITKLNGEPLNSLEELNKSLEKKAAGERVELTVERDNKEEEIQVMLDTFPEDMNADGRTGLGILYPFTQRDVQFDPPVEIEAGSIGGPSAGLMFSLEVYNQLTEKDLTNGLDIAGTGTINEKGEVGPIGGISQKIVAADNENVDVFFAPDNGLSSPTNYEEAVKTARAINSEMEIVPVKEFNDALSYLQNRLEKKTVHEKEAG